MELFYWENQIPVFTPNNVAILEGKTIKLTRIKILVVLRVRVSTDKIANIYSLYRVVTERKTHTEISCIFCFCDIKPFHNYPPKVFSLY